MDTLKDFFADLKDRISNPFVSSFAVSWLIHNYKIVTALTFYKVKDFDAFISIVTNNANWMDSLWWPIAWAFGYTFIFQAFKSFIRAFNAWLVLYTNKKIFKFTKQYPITVEEHQKMADVLDKQKEAYSKLISSQSGLKIENDTLISENSNLVLKYKEDIERINSEHDALVESKRVAEEKRVKAIQDSTGEEIKKLNFQVRNLTVDKEDLNYVITELKNDIDRNRSILFDAETNLASVTTEYEKTLESERGKIMQLEQKYKADIDSLYEQINLSTPEDFKAREDRYISTIDGLRDELELNHVAALQYKSELEAMRENK